MWIDYIDRVSKELIDDMHYQRISSQLKKLQILTILENEVSTQTSQREDRRETIRCFAVQSRSGSIKTSRSVKVIYSDGMWDSGTDSDGKTKYELLKTRI